MRPKDSRPVWGEGAGKVPDGNSPTPYSTARRDLRGGQEATPVPTATDGACQPVLTAVLFELDFAATLSLQGEVKMKRYFLAFVLASFPG